MLQQILGAGLLDIGDEDTKFEFLEEAAEDVADLLTDAPEKVPFYTLIALDPQVDPGDPVLQEVEAVVTKRWKTLRNRFRDRPRQLLRAVILEALDRAAQHHGDSVPGIIWLSGASYFPHADLGQEREILSDFLLRMGNAAEADATQAWSLPEGKLPKMPTPLIKVPEIAVPKIDAKKLQAGFEAASGPQSSQGTAHPDSNPHWPNQGSPWSHQFAPRAAKAVSGALVPVMDELGKGLGGTTGVIEEALRDHAKAIRAALKTAMDRMNEAVEAERTRTALLWWRQALYSPSAQTGYRRIRLQAAAFCMALDLHYEAPSKSPRSVEYLLREAIRELVGPNRTSEDLPAVTIPAFCEEVRAGLAELPTRPEVVHSPCRGGRMPLLLYIRSRISDLGGTDEDLLSSVGLDPDTMVSLDDLAVWLFRDLQAEALVKEQGA